MTEKKVTIIGMFGCPHCEEAKEFCEKEGLQYNYIDIIDEKNEKYIPKIIDGDKATIPKICVDDELLFCISGYDEKKLRELLSH